MTRRFLTDKEIDLNNGDFLKTKVYADNLAKIIRSTEQNEVFTIGLYGNWGSGKSSIIETAKSEFKAPDKIKFITYDAWQYSNDSFRRMFLRCLIKELNYSGTDFMKRFYENESIDVDNKFKLSNFKSSIFFASFSILYVILYFSKFQIDNKVSFFTIFTAIGTLIALISGLFHQLKISITKPYFFAPEQFEECFKEIASKSLKSNTVIDKIKYVLINDKTVTKLKKLVIVIDNIDRCHSDIAYQLLTDIKTFLGSQKFSIVFIIPVDDKALLKNFFSKSKSGFEHNDKEEFLRKIFNVTLRIKPYNSTDMFAFTKSICEANELKLKNETINIIGKEYSGNPRRVIQLINNLNVELNNYDDDFSRINETIICCILIIREEYPEFYDKVYSNCTLLINYQFEKNDGDKNLLEVNRFMKIANSEFQHCKNSVLNQVLMNTDNYFKEISNEVIEMVNTFDVNQLSEFLKENNEVKTIVYDFLCFKIDQAHDNDLKNDFSKYIEMIGVLNNVESLEISNLFRVFEKFESKIKQGFYYSENLDSLMMLVKFESTEVKRYKLKKRLVDFIKTDINSTEEVHKKRCIEIFNSLLTNLKDEDTSNEISECYKSNYNELVSVEKLSEVQFKILVSKSFIRDRVNEINLIDLEHTSERNSKYECVKYILEKHHNKKFIIDSVFMKFISNDYFRDIFEARIDYLILLNDFVKYSLNYVNNYQNEYVDAILTEVFDLLNTISLDPPNKPVEFLDAIQKEENKDNIIDVLMDFVYNYYKLTSNLGSLHTYLIKIDKVSPRKVRKIVVDFMNLDEDIMFYFSSISGSYDFEDENLFKLIRYYLTISDDKVFDNNAKLNCEIIENLMIDIDDENYRDIINTTLEFVIDNSINANFIFKIFKNALSENRKEFLKNLNLNIKKAFANYLSGLDEIYDFYDIEMLTFCKEVDNDVLSKKYINSINISSFSISEIDKLLDFLVKLYDEKRESNFKVIFNRKLIEHFDNKPFKNNTPIGKRIKEKIILLKDYLK